MRTLILVCLACSTVWSQAQISPKRPPVTEKSGTKTAQQETKSSKAQQPASTEISAGQKKGESPPTQEASANKVSEELEINRKLATFTMWLVIVGALQIIALLVQARIFWVTLNENRKLIRATAESANAATVGSQSAVESNALMLQSLILVKRPKVTIRNVEIEGLGTLLSGQSVGTAGTLQFYNSGGSEAHVLGVTCRLFPFDKLPMKAPFESPAPSSDIKLPPGCYGTRSFPFEAVDFSTFTAIQQKTMRLYIMGELVYRDSLGLQRTTRFCRLFNAKKKRFFPIADPDYENAD